MPNESLRVYLVAALPPPLGGMSIWTRAYLDAAERHGILPVLRRVGARSEEELLRPSSRVGRVGRGVLLPAAEVVLRAAKGCDVVHVCASGRLGLWSGLVITQSAMLRGLPVVLHVHSSLSGAMRPARRWLERLSKHPKVRVVTPSHEDSAKDGGLTRIDNFVGSAFSSRTHWHGPSRDKTLRLLYVGWLIREKGLFELVEAVARLEHVSLDLVGPSPRPADVRALEALAKDPRLAGRMTLRPSVSHPELPALMASYDALVFPSHAESFGMVTAEAMTVGLPVLGSRVGLLWDAPDDVFVPVPARDVDGLERVLRKVRDEKESLLPRLSEAARAFAAATVSEESVLGKWRSLYASLLGR